MQIIASLRPRQSVRGEKPHPTSGVPVMQSTADLKEKALKNNPQPYSVRAVPKE